MRKSWLIALLSVAAGVGVSAAETPVWLEGWSFGGDLRLRYEGTQFDQDNKKTRNRGRFRLRLSAKKKIMEALSFELRLASGGGGATSTNQSFDESFSGKDIYIDRVFVVYKYQDWRFGGGKLKNPFHSTNVVWDSDVNPEGFFQSFDNQSFYANFGEMMVEEERSSSDTNLVAAQIGLKKKDSYNVSAAFYSYQGLQLNDAEIDYQFLEGVGDVNLGPGLLRLTYVKNTTSEINEEDTAYGAFYKFSSGPFSYQFKYAHIELNSALGQFTDSDFGFNDKEGYAVSGGYKVSKYVSWNLTLFSVDSIQAIDKGFNRVHFDFNLKI